jgi:hypothetical protein
VLLNFPLPPLLSVQHVRAPGTTAQLVPAPKDWPQLCTTDVLLLLPADVLMQEYISELN